MTSKLFQVVILSLAICIPGIVAAQDLSTALADTSPAAASEKPLFHGFNSYASLSGIVTGSGSLIKLDSSVGYDFNRNFGVFVGMPLYFSSTFSGASSPSGHVAGLGDAYIGAEVFVFPKVFRYSSSVTVGLPTGSVAKGFSPGSVTADWTNSFRRSFGKFTPTVSAGVANTVGVAVGVIPSSRIVDGQLAAKGTFVHVEEGAEFDLRKSVYIGGEGYHIVPFASGTTGSQSGGGDAITADNGIDAWVGFLPQAFLSTEIGYSRSVTFAQNSLSFRLGLNVGKMIRNHSREE